MFNSYVGQVKEEMRSTPSRGGSIPTDLIAHDKKCMPLCNFMFSAARERGIGDINIYDHETSKKTRNAP